ncbi:hypothetical protein M9H77_27094 [Catharanthus roseus]|uniref:Uncharacterized protein n=1 Tax=Catharanthus roseus TaxID=4058 RepID=A0ACC0AC17_CATRO|nr:hypothetical protein M9H77_27094 [Catharanthus roseus]
MEFLGIELFDRILAPDLHLVNGRVSGLHCTWLVLRTRASSDDVDGFLTLRVDPLKEGRSTWRAWPNRLKLVIRFSVFKKIRQSRRLKNSMNLTQER